MRCTRGLRRFSLAARPRLLPPSFYSRTSPPRIIRPASGSSPCLVASPGSTGLPFCPLKESAKAFTRPDAENTPKGAARLHRRRRGVSRTFPCLARVVPARNPGMPNHHGGREPCAFFGEPWAPGLMFVGREEASRGLATSSINNTRDRALVALPRTDSIDGRKQRRVDVYPGEREDNESPSLAFGRVPVVGDAARRGPSMPHLAREVRAR